MSTVIPFPTKTPRKLRTKCRHISCRHYATDPYAANWVYLEDSGGLPPRVVGWWEPDCLEVLARIWTRPLYPYLPQRLVRHDHRASFVTDVSHKPLKR
jgi:hypothetical protein